MPIITTDELFNTNKSSTGNILIDKQNNNIPVKTISTEELFGDKQPDKTIGLTTINRPPNLLTKPIETIAKSGGEFFGNIFSAIGHPIRTAKGLGSTAVGFAQKAIPGEQPQEKYANAMIDFYKNRYGSLEKAKMTALEDPVGFASDISIFLTGGGAAVTKVGQISKLGKLAQAGKIASSVGKTVEPLSATLRGIGKVSTLATAGKKIAPFASKLDKQIIDAAKIIDVDLPASAISTSKAVPAIETLVSKGFFGEDIIQKVTKAQIQLSKYADNIIAQTGKADDLTSAGQTIFKGADTYRNKFIQIKNELYNKALLPTNGKEVIKVAPESSLNFIDMILQNKQEAAKLLGSSEDISYFRNLANKLRKGTQEETGILNRQGQMITKNIPIHGKEIQSAIKELNNKINNFTDPITTGNKGTLKKLVTLLSDDLDNAIVKQRPDLAQAIDKANNFYSEGINKLNSYYGEKIFALKDQPDKILPAIINKSTSIEDIPKIYEIIGKENIPAVQSAFLEDFFKGAKNPEGNFTPHGITRQINKYGNESKLQKILAPEQYKAVKNIEQVARGLGKAEKIASGSQTAFIGRLLGETMTFFSNPMLSFKFILGDALFSKFISSPTGQKLLTEGIQLTGETGKRIMKFSPKTTIPSQVLRTEGIIENQNQ